MIFPSSSYKERRVDSIRIYRISALTDGVVDTIYDNRSSFIPNWCEVPFPNIFRI